MDRLALHLAALRQSISDARLDAYRIDPSEQELELHARYLWNLALGEALYPSLHCVEVALRNALHSAISASYGERWFDDSAVLGDPWAQEQVRKAKDQLREARKPEEPGRIVAELDFGFWTSLLGHRYARSAVTPAWQHPLWGNSIKQTFPHFPQPGGNPNAGRHILSRRFVDIRRSLRNRISHHEPIWRGWWDKSTHTLTPLDTQHAQLMEAIGWISPEMRATIELMNRFPEVYRRGHRPFRDLLLTWA